MVSLLLLMMLQQLCTSIGKLVGMQIVRVTTMATTKGAMLTIVAEDM